MCLLTLGYLLVLIVVIYFIYKSCSSYWAGLEDVLSALNAKRVGFSTWTFLCEGQTVNLYYIQDNITTYLDVYAEGDFSVTNMIVVGRDLQGDELIVNTGISSNCKDKSFMDNFTANEETKFAIMQSLEIFNEIQIDGHRCTISKCKNIFGISEVGPQTIMDTAKNLLVLIRNIPRSSI